MHVDFNLRALVLRFPPMKERTTKEQDLEIVARCLRRARLVVACLFGVSLLATAAAAWLWQAGLFGKGQGSQLFGAALVGSLLVIGAKLGLLCGAVPLSRNPRFTSFFGTNLVGCFGRFPQLCGLTFLASTSRPSRSSSFVPTMPELNGFEE